MSDKGKAVATASKKRKHSTPSIPSIYKNYARNPLQDEDKENQQLPSTNPGKFPNLYCELRFSRYQTTKLNIEKKLLLPNDLHDVAQRQVESVERQASVAERQVSVAEKQDSLIERQVAIAEKGLAIMQQSRPYLYSESDVWDMLTELGLIELFN
ncbi:hypothetical protein Ahy_B05g076593 [Arachis hypogaea]|uniref:Uncharacterized protein n=1 Tax=Arachis hypogaea TaxID=3818 RepID=A0A444Z3K6_ARAHY|nr:hypothetical protein Ahy_B05g076593 [Arachis hypogaea]